MRETIRKPRLLAQMLAFVLVPLLCGTALAQTTEPQGERITYQATGEPLHRALSAIERLSGYYRVQYAQEDVQPYTVTVNIKNQTMTQAVTQLLQGTPLGYEVHDRFIQIYRRQQTGSRQGRQPDAIRGLITDTDGEPLPGATIREMDGSQRGTVADAQGAFTLLVGPDAGRVRLLISYVGKKDVELTATTRRSVSVVMEDDVKLLEDVLVTGYQQLSRERVTGAFDKVGQDVLASRPTSDISSALQGMVDGMQATENEDGSVDFLIRGTSSLYADTAPLIVVDGFPIEGTFSSINPNDVESITVLKDAAAASIWGARSANGVIVVTTKRGKQNHRLNVDVQTFWRIGTRPDIDYITALADSPTTVDYEIMALENGWNLGEYTPGFTSIMSPLSLAMEYWYANKYRGLSDAAMEAGLDELRGIDNRSQLKKYLMQTPVLQQYNASISSGNERSDSYLSLMYEKNDEATIKRGYERFMVNYSGTYHFNSRLTGTITTTWQKRQQDRTGVTIPEFTELSPYELLVDDDGSYATNIKYFNRFELEDINTEDFPYSDFSYNMLREVRSRKYTTDSDNWRVQLGLNLNIIKGLDYNVKFQYERNRSEYRDMDGEDSFATRYTVNFYTDYDSSTGTVGTSYLPTGAIIATGSSENRNTVLRNQLTYARTFGRHDISALAGTEMSEYKTSSTTNPYIYGYDESSNTAQDPYYGSYTSVATFLSSAYYTTLPNQGYTFSDRTDRYLSFFFNAGYVYDEKYGLSFSIRSDGSNFVTEDKSLRWSPMWSVGGKWNLWKENFMQDLDWLDYLSLRLTYGLNGNAEKSTSTQTLINVSANSTTHTNVATIASYGNPSLRWETTHTINFGLDFSLWKSHLYGKLDVYSRRSKDVIGDVTIAAVYGSTSQTFNNAELTNRGFELELTGQGDIKSIGLGIQSTVTFSYNKNKVTDLYNPSQYCYQYMYASDYDYFVQGRPVRPVYAYEFAGTVDGTPYVYGPDGQTYSMGVLTLANNTYGSEDFLTYKGSRISPYTLGWATRLSWKGLSLYVFLTGKLGGVFRAPTSDTPPLVGSSKEFVSRYVSYFAQSDGTKYPTYPNADDFYCYRWASYMPYLSAFVEDASFIRLKEVTLSYQLPAQWLSRVRIKQAKVFLQARDLGMIWTANSLGYDPEWLPGDCYGNGSSKPAASFTLGLNVNF